MKREPTAVKCFDVVVLIFAGLVMISYIFYVGGWLGKEYYNPVSNALYAVLNLLVTVLIAYKISYFSAQGQNIKHQKNIAKTSIRHIRVYLSNLYNLEKIIEDKIEKIKYENLPNAKIYEQYLVECRNHIISIKNGILSSEQDFKDIVGKEFKVESSLIAKMQSDMIELKRKYEKIKNQKTQEKATAEEVNKIKHEIGDIKTSIEKTKMELPFGEPFRYFPSTHTQGVSATPVFSHAVRYPGSFFGGEDNEPWAAVTAFKSSDPQIKKGSGDGETM